MCLRETCGGVGMTHREFDGNVMKGVPGSNHLRLPACHESISERHSNIINQ